MKLSPFLGARVRWTRYTLQDALVFADGERRDGEAGYESEDLAAHLARVVRADREAAAKSLLEFYGAFGFLGNGMSSGGRAVLIRGRREVRACEDAGWALAHARNVRTILDLAVGRGAALDTTLDQFRKADHRRARLRQLSGEPLEADSPLRRRIPTCDAAVYGTLSTEVCRQLDRRRGGPEALSLAQTIIAELVNPNLVGRRVYDPKLGAATFDFGTLVEFLYWQLADRLGATTLRQCPCGSPFFAVDPRQKFCPPLPPQKDSRCAQRFRRRAQRAKRR